MNKAWKTGQRSAMRSLVAGGIVALCALLSACGGGGADEALTVTPQALVTHQSQSQSLGSLQSRPLAASVARPAPPDTAALLDWAQTRYPILFETGPQTAVGDYDGQRYDYRHYPRSNNYLGVRDGEVFGLGPFTGNQLRSFGPVANYGCDVYPVVCAGAAADILALNGPGLATAGGKATFVPTSAATVQETVANCEASDGVGVCTSTLHIEWAASASVRLAVSLHANYPAPGVPPGYGVNGIDLEYAVFGAPGAYLLCKFSADVKAAAGAACDLEALGVRLNPIARALSFTDTPVTVLGGARMVLNGTLTY